MINSFDVYLNSVSKKFSHPETSEMGYHKEFEIPLEGIFFSPSQTLVWEAFTTSSFPKSCKPAAEGTLETQTGKAFINKTQYFGDVPEIAWNFYIGGYQPAQKWLKDRKRRTLTNTEIEHYQKIIIALSETHRIMSEVDNVIID